MQPDASARGTGVSERRGADQSACFQRKDGGEMEFAESPLGRFHQCVMFDSVREYLGFEMMIKTKRLTIA